MKWQLPTFSAQTLRWRLREAPASAEVTIDEPGEYEGPFILDQPIRLSGLAHNPRGVTLWTRRGPAIIVRSPDVALESLNIELTWNDGQQHDTAIIYAPGCMPYIQAELQGRVKPMATANNSSGWRLPDLIDLGDIRAKYPVSLPMLIQTPGPAQLSSDLSGMTVLPTATPAGENLIRVMIPGDRLFKDTLLAGQLIIQSDNETRTVWLIGRVLEDEFQAWVKDKLQLTAPSQRKFACSLGMVLGRRTLAGEIGADALDDTQAYLRKEECGVWSVFQPRPVGVLLRVAGRSVAVGQRLIVTGGETIELGVLKLKVETERTDLALEVSGSVDFGRLSAHQPAYLSVKNQSSQTWSGQFKTMVPWIVVPHPQVTCPPRQQIQVAVQLGPAVPGEAGQQVNVTSALVLEGAKELWAISAQVMVDIKGGLELTPRTLDWGTVSDLQKAQVLQLRLKNTGNQLWQGVATTPVPWLNISPSSLKCAAGAETVIEVRLNQQAATLPDGPADVAEAVVIEGNNQRITATIQLYKQQPRAQIVLQPKVLDWGTVTNWSTAARQTVEVNNIGDKDWQGKVEVKVNWLDVTPAVVHCPAGGHATVTVRLNAAAQHLPSFLQKVPAAVQFVGEGTTAAVLVRVKMEPPQIQLVPDRLDIVVANRNQLPRYFVQLHNQGGQPWNGVVTTTLRWLTVTPSTVTCPAGGSATVEVALNQNVNTVFRRAVVIEELKDFVQIYGDSVQLSLTTRLEIKYDVVASQPPPPSPSPPPILPPILPTGLMVDFGTVNELTVGGATRKVQFVNTNAYTMRGNVRVNDYFWLEVTPTTFDCLPNQEVVLTVQLNQAAGELRPKRYEVPDAIVIESNGKQEFIRVIAEIRRAQEKSFPPTGLKVDFGVISDFSGDYPAHELQFANPYPHVVEGTVRVNGYFWLDVTPSTFSSRPGQRIAITVCLNPAASNLRPKQYVVEDAIVIESMGQQQLVGVAVEIQRSHRPVSPKPIVASPALTFSPTFLDFGEISKQSHELSTCTLDMHNHSTVYWSGTATSTLPWLDVSPSRVACPPGRTASISARLNLQALRLHPKPYVVSDAIVIEGNGERFQVEVCVIVNRT